MVIKNYLNLRSEKDKKYDTQVCMQLLRPESITHYELSSNKEEIKNDQIVCIESMKLNLLAKSCLCPGLVVLVTNLIKSSISPTKELTKKFKNRDWKWLLEYW